jgi:PAS domain S-box-containing protein
MTPTAPSRWSFSGVSPRVLALIVTTAAAATALYLDLWPSLPRAAEHDPKRLLGFAVVAVALQFVSIDIYGKGGTSFALCGLLALGFVVNPAASVNAAVLVALIRFFLTRGKLYRAVFDASQLVLATGLATGFFQIFSQQPGWLRACMTLPAALIYFLLNNSLLSLAMGLEEHSSPFTVFRERFLWLLPYTLAAGPMAGGLLLAYQGIGIIGLALFALPPAFMFFSVRQYINHTRESVEEINKINGELKDANQQLAESEEHFRSLIEDASDAIVVIEADGRCSYGSPALVRLLGYPLTELVGARALKLIGHDLRRSALKGLLGQIRRNSAEPFELLLHRRDGQEILTEVLVRHFDGDATARIVVTLRDVTRRRRAEEAAGRLEEQLQHSQRLEAVGQLAGGVAHDFNNLLTVIMGCSEMLLLGLDEDDSRREEAEEIARAAARAASLTRQLLAFSRKQVLEPKLIDLNSIVLDLETMLGRLLGSGIDLKTACCPTPATVFADPGQLEQVIVNLVVNARDAMEDAGQIDVSLRESDLEEELPTSCEPGRYIILTVSDNGSGMSEETQQKIFEPFYTTKEVGKGTGLGLATVYGIVQQSGGQIELKSELGAGSSFRLYFPFRSGLVESDREDAQPRPQATGETVLLVDDDDSVRRLATTVLEDAGYRVLSAKSGLDALELSRSFSRPVDLLLTDIVMPEMTGALLALELGRERPETKILFMSGHIGSIQLADEGPPLLNKPFNASSLLQAVQGILRPSVDKPALPVAASQSSL